MPVAVLMAPEWLDFFGMTGAFLLVAAGGLTWMFFFRKTRRRHYKHRHHHHSHPADLTFPEPGRVQPDRQQGRTSSPPPTPRP